MEDDVTMLTDNKGAKNSDGEDEQEEGESSQEQEDDDEDEQFEREEEDEQGSDESSEDEEEVVVVPKKRKYKPIPVEDSEDEEEVMPPASSLPSAPAPFRIKAGSGPAAALRLLYHLLSYYPIQPPRLWPLKRAVAPCVVVATAPDARARVPASAARLGSKPGADTSIHPRLRRLRCSNSCWNRHIWPQAPFTLAQYHRFCPPPAFGAVRLE
ncbi:hypothetical protein B0H16DRAFT_1901720 [Mycena metata]|uniref:Uncharacterized protein n=1 Tax=Mycena metata TaxID=1033252 RepID=A0AAD7GUS6_9AGAR|nr:hypothetical protein B0H16DRAFT_1901720 [Mycena metata]